VLPVKCELDFYIPEDGNLHIHRRENLKPYNQRIAGVWTPYQACGNIVMWQTVHI
jgi:hypothetical protein